MSKCGASGRPFLQRAFQALAGNKGFQPQSKPPVYTGGFDYSFEAIEYEKRSKHKTTYYPGGEGPLGK